MDGTDGGGVAVAAAGKTKDARAVRRMLAISLVLEGLDRETAEKTCGMDCQPLRGKAGQETVRGTVFPPNGHRYNTEGLDALENRKGTHRPRRKVPEQLAELAVWVGAGPDPVRWRCGALTAQRSAGTHRGGVRRGSA